MESWVASFDWEAVDRAWYAALAKHGEPSQCSGVEVLDYSEVLHSCSSLDVNAITNIVDLLAQGRWVLLRSAFSQSEVDQIRSQALRLRESKPSEFHKMTEGAPDFWRDIDEETGKNYGVPVVKRAHYFFPWNDAKALFDLIYPRWRLLKLLGGASPLADEGLTPVSGKCDRVQIVEYPPGSGYLAAHHDPKHNQRLAMCGTMSKRGLDYSGGGIWVEWVDGSRVSLEDQQEVGDLGVGYAEIVHGVDPVDAVSNLPQNASGTGGGSRWFLGLYTNDSDMNVDRVTLRGV